MVVLRLRRGGRTHSPHYRIVAQEKRSKLNGAYIESIGHYHPTNKTAELVIDADRAKHWLSLGAMPSETVINLLVKEGILPKKSHVKRTKVMPKVEEEKKAPAEAVAEAAPAEAETEAETEATTEPTDETEAEPQTETESEK